MYVSIDLVAPSSQAPKSVPYFISTGREGTHFITTHCVAGGVLGVVLLSGKCHRLVGNSCSDQLLIKELRRV